MEGKLLLTGSLIITHMMIIIYASLYNSRESQHFTFVHKGLVLMFSTLAFFTLHIFIMSFFGILLTLGSYPMIFYAELRDVLGDAVE